MVDGLLGRCRQVSCPFQLWGRWRSIHSLRSRGSCCLLTNICHGCPQVCNPTPGFMQLLCFMPATASLLHCQHMHQRGPGKMGFRQPQHRSVLTHRRVASRSCAMRSGSCSKLAILGLNPPRVSCICIPHFKTYEAGEPFNVNSSL